MRFLSASFWVNVSGVKHYVEQGGKYSRFLRGSWQKNEADIFRCLKNSFQKTDGSVQNRSLKDWNLCVFTDDSIRYSRVSFFILRAKVVVNLR